MPATAPLGLTIKPSMAWLLVFVPAFSYFVSTRLQSSGFRWGRSNTLGDPISTSLLHVPQGQPSVSSHTTCVALSQVFYLQESCNHNNNGLPSSSSFPLQYSLNLQAKGRGMKGIVASIWKHDEELGRGYLLFSQSHRNGRIWRWEVGGGPIAIGRSLHLENSGCRSSQYQQCYNDTSSSTADDDQNTSVGSGGMAIDFVQGTRHSEGALVVAEWGEGRIIRMEEENGARTPLMVQVPSLCGDDESSSRTTRIHKPKTLLINPYGDLLVADTRHCPKQQQKAAIYRLPQAVHVESLSSLTESRKAHAWNHTKHDIPVDVLYHDNIQEIGGVAMDPSWLNMYVTVRNEKGRVLLLQMPAVTVEDEDEEGDSDEDADGEEEEEEDQENNLPPEKTEEPQSTADGEKEEETATEPLQANHHQRRRGLLDEKARIVMDLTQLLQSTAPGPVTVSEKGHVFVAAPQGIAIIAPPDDDDGSAAAAEVLGVLPMPSPPTSLTLGEDHFLYAFSDDSLFRIRVRMGPVMVPTNLVVGKKSKGK